MKISLFILLIIIALPGYTSSGEKKEESNLVESFEIVVIDASTEDPIPAALVKIMDIELEAYTDFDGLVKFQSIQSGQHDLEVSLVSYQKMLLENFRIDQNNRQIVVKLHP